MQSKEHLPMVSRPGRALAPPALAILASDHKVEETPVHIEEVIIRTSVLLSSRFELAQQTVDSSGGS